MGYDKIRQNCPALYIIRVVAEESHLEKSPQNHTVVLFLSINTGAIFPGMSSFVIVFFWGSNPLAT